MDDELEILISLQQQELMAAKTLESDLDFAFRIQMQEAMDVSLLHHQNPSSSSSTLLFPLEEEERNGHVSDLMKLQNLELERFQQERKDQELCEAEMRRISFDIKRRIHDASFAREIRDMADDEWEEYGDHFEKPIHLGCSSSSSTTADPPTIQEPFKLYFKGLISTEPVKGRLVTLSAIGIAVCDPLNNLVLKIQKPLIGAGMSRGVVETKALIEGLNAVLSLDIKNVDVFCDYVPLFHQVTGKWAAKQRKIANLLSQIHPLRRKFERCHMSLLPRCQCKFVFRLAKDAIDSQIMKTTEPSGNANSKETCSICLEDTDASQIFIVDGCLHRYCFTCMKQHVEVKLLHGLLPGCPHDGCNTKLVADSSRKFLPPRLVEIMTQRLKEASIPEADRLYCPYPKCSALMSRSEMMLPPEESSSIYRANDSSGYRKCIKCNGSFCLNCKVPWHTDMSCHEYKRFNPHPRAEDAKLQSLARQKLWRQCIKCNHMIELAEGCFHMTCRCGYEFCYTCGAEWKNKKAMCSCPLWDEENIWHDDDDESLDDFDDNDEEDEEDYESDWEYDYYRRRY
ncbi:E3 ubiquitin-protein ligase RSL1-like [Magnolia sinica]|uniref:E3 ubiquitin-protein ligase RSL1-like n=1 Tax=Magnolia sinica TaxID=86752 RepID=UPI002659EDE2|nr:E3 ubiquitin-protein ligase RSL1-like [Magnolia sinica]